MSIAARAGAFLAATSLFLLQPLVARALVPLYGGTSWVWIAVSVFFQLSLIVGYRAATTMRPSTRSRTHAAASAAALLITAAGFWLLLRRTAFDLPTELAVALHLLVTVGAIAVFLAMASPLLQIATEADTRSDGYRLYAWSNAGSLVGLLLYPTVLESFLPLRIQMAIWFVLATSAAVLINLTLRRAPLVEQRPVEWRFPGRWRVFYISAVAGGLSLAVTARLTIDLGALPLLWVLPLLVFLLSYIVVFAELPIVKTLAAAAPMAVMIACHFFFNVNVYLSALDLVLLWCALLFLIQCGLQARLRALAPSGAAQGAFYVALASGGFIGSLIVGCLVPIALDRVSRMLETVLGTSLVNPLLASDPVPELGWTLIAAAFGLMSTERWRARELAVAAVMGAAILIVPVVVAGEMNTISVALGVLAGAVALTYLPAVAGRPLLFPAAVTGIVVACSYLSLDPSREMFRTRNIYGVLIGRETPDQEFTELFHGTTRHGMQVSGHDTAGNVVPQQPLVPLTYYHRRSPIGEVFKSIEVAGCPLNVGIVGLGAGSLAGYARAGDSFEFYEIDPAVIDAAQSEHFSFVSAARQRGAKVAMIEGDGRRTLARRQGSPLDLIVIDAFSSDSIPAHLLTLESFESARAQLAPGGYIVFHTSNRYFDINRIVSANAVRLGWNYWLRRGERSELGTSASEWVITRPSSDAAPNRCAGNVTTQSNLQAEPKPVWTDEFSNPLTILRPEGLISQLTRRGRR